MVRASVCHKGWNVRNTLNEWKGYRGMRFKKIKLCGIGHFSVKSHNGRRGHKGSKEIPLCRAMDFKNCYSFFNTSAGLALATFMVCIPIIAMAMIMIIVAPISSSPAPIG